MRSIVAPGKLDELKCVIKSFKEIIQIIILTETWIKSEDDACKIQIPCYTHYYNFRQQKRGGGVSIFVHDNLKHNLVLDLCEEDNHYLWIRVSKFSLNFGAIYKPERTNSDRFLETYSEHLHKFKRAVIFGDFNYDLIHPTHATRKYKTVLKENGFKVLNNVKQEYCTRETSMTRTILDHVCTDLKNNNFHFAIVDSALSDHKHIYFEIKQFKPPPPLKVKYSTIDYNQLYQTVANIDLETTNCYNELSTKLIEAITNNKTAKTKILNTPKQDWINKDIIKGLETRNRLWELFKKDKSNKTLERKFTLEKSKMSKIIQKTKAIYYNKLFRETMKKPRKMWKLINELSSNKTKNSSFPDKLIINSKTILERKDICEQFNIYFSTIGEVLANEIPERYHRHHITSLDADQNNKMDKIAPATEDEILKIVGSLDPNTSCGIDGVSTKALKCVINLIVSALTKCINNCLDNGIFPDSMKVAKVSPIHKTGPKYDPYNYRPISVLPVISKIFEKVLHTRLESFLNSKNFFYKKQYGFRQKSNTLAATIDLITAIKNKIDQKQIALGIFIDLKKAFDTVSHQILIKKLQLIGIEGKALEIFDSYLQNRKQVVKMGETQSSSMPITYGVPQGSILGPLLFLIYVNDIHNINLKGDITLYADDTSVFYFGPNINEIMTHAQTDLNMLNCWFQSNLLTINSSKTKYVVFSAKNKNVDTNLQLDINGQTLSKTSKEKYLGLTLDSHLTWRPHIENISSKLASLAGILCRNKNSFPRKIRYLIYNSLVKPHIEYLIEIWGTTAKKYINMIQTKQNKIIKILFNYNYYTSTEKIYKETQLMNITQTYVYLTCILVRKVLNNEINSNISFTRKSRIQKIKLRSANNLVIRKSRTNYGKRNIEVEGVLLYNKLPIWVKSAQSTGAFKRLLKTYIKKI